MAVAGWYADPYGAQGQLRYWDGAQWTANVMPRPASGPMQGAPAAGGAAGAMGAQAQAAQMQGRAMHESIPLGANTTAAPTAGAYVYQGQPAEQQYGAQAAQANPYAGAAQNQGYAQVANAYEAAAQSYAQAAGAYDAAAQGYAQAGQYDAAAAQAYNQYDPNAQAAYGQYDPNAQAYGQTGASPYYQGGYDPYGQMAPVQATQAPEGSNRTLRLLAFVFSIIAIVGVVAITVMMALAFFGVITYTYGSPWAVVDSLGALAFLVALPLAWLIPFCIHDLGILRGTKRNTVLYAVLSLLFGGFLPGLFLLIAKKDPKPLY